MSLHPRVPGEIPAQTELIAHRAFPKGCLCMRLRDALGPLFADQDFLDLFPQRGRPAWPPHQLVIVSVLQFLENLSDRQAAAAVRARIDWKYLLGLELTDPGFDHSLLSEFRDRQLAGTDPEHLLDLVLDRLREHGLLKRPGRQRTDSTHVLAAIRRLNRLENVAEHLRAALNAIATIEPDWLAAWVPMVWFDRYARRIEDFRLPQDKAGRTAYAERTGHDGRTLLQALYHADAPRQLRDLPTVQALPITWIHQFVTDDGEMHLRDAKDLPPSRRRNASPYDDQTRHSLKRSISWTGYKVHYSETCDTDAPHLITHVATTDATVTDVEMTAAIQNALIRADLAPREHLLDTGLHQRPAPDHRCRPRRHRADRADPARRLLAGPSRTGLQPGRLHHRLGRRARHLPTRSPQHPLETASRPRRTPRHPHRFRPTGLHSLPRPRPVHPLGNRRPRPDTEHPRRAREHTASPSSAIHHRVAAALPAARRRRSGDLPSLTLLRPATIPLRRPGQDAPATCAHRRSHQSHPHRRLAGGHPAGQNQGLTVRPATTALDHHRIRQQCPSRTRPDDPAGRDDPGQAGGQGPAMVGGGAVTFWEPIYPSTG